MVDATMVSQIRQQVDSIAASVLKSAFRTFAPFSFPSIPISRNDLSLCPEGPGHLTVLELSQRFLARALVLSFVFFTGLKYFQTISVIT
jgi:hypothetical protein